MQSLSWTLNKAPAMSNSKLLIINLPPGMMQPPSIFHANAYPPSYGFAPYPHHGGLPGYAPGFDPYAGGYPDIEKGDWMHPPAMFGTPITNDDKIREVDDDAATPVRRDRDDDALSTIHEADEAVKQNSLESLPEHSPKPIFEEMGIKRASQAAYVERDDPENPGAKKRFSLNEARLGDGDKRRSKSQKTEGSVADGAYI